MNLSSILTVFALVTTLGLQAQFNVNNDKSSMTIDGTSNIHDWTENVGTISGTMDATTSGNALKDISSLKLKIPVKSISSGKSGMDKNTYKALKESSSPNILFLMKSATISGNTIKMSGTLSVAGKARTVSFTSTYKVVNGEVVISGSLSLKMTDFGVEPPTALMGSISTGDSVTMTYKIYFTK